MAFANSQARILAAVWMTLALSASASAATTLVEKGRSGYRIVIPANAIPSERYAAEELQRYLDRMSGAKLPIVSDTGPIESREILLAGGRIVQYVELLREQVAGKNVHAHIFDPPTAPYLTDDFLRRAEQILDEAERLADNDTHRFRVQVARLPIGYVQLATNRVTGDGKVDLLRRFLSIARKAGISNISEGRSLNDWAKGMGAE